MIFSLVATAIITLAFCFIRPYNNVVYAPRAKHADSKHAPPPIGKGLFGWITTVVRTNEPELVEKLGLDAAVFMRFVRMMRNMFSALTLVGCGVLIPLNVINSSSGSFFDRLTPISYYKSSDMWAYVIISYIFDGIIFYFLWANYRHILRLRRAYLQSPDYQHSLHARTLLLTDIPSALRSDDGIVQITERVKSTGDVPRAAIARNVRDLPQLIEEHDKAVRELEKVLAMYLKNPNRLPAKRPTCKASKGDKSYRQGQEVDAIEYLTARIKELEAQVKEVRLSVDKRNPMAYGFASYNGIPVAHSVAYAARKGGPDKTVVELAPKPQDLIWKNLAMSKQQRRSRNFVNNLWVVLLTVAWIVPNILIAVFLSNLSNLGQVWPSFRPTLYAHPKTWGVVQGVVSPAITTAFYFFLPAIFRKLVTRAGDLTRTSRERHVLDKLFSFFIFNNLVVFSLFSAIWAFVATIIEANDAGGSIWDAIKANNPFVNIIATLITVTPYWCSWLLQRNLGAAIDLGQLFSLTWGSFSRRFLSPTPREQIELTAPQPFQYAAYYNYFVFYTAVALCFGPLQPLALAIVALYFWMDSFAKKYMIMYIFITKYESGGLFWKALYDRVLIATGLGNVVVACLVATKGSSWITMLACMAPLPFLIVGFKWYCVKQFDDKIRYYSTGSGNTEEALVSSGDQKRRKGDKVGVRFGNPALYKPLMTPMVAAKSQHMLKQIYSGRTSMDESSGYAGFSDVYMEDMAAGRPGKSRANPDAPFEFVRDSQLDFSAWKDRPEFADQAGGNGELFGRAADLSRPGTPSTILSGHTRTATMESSPYNSPYHSRAQSRDVYGRGRPQSGASDYTHVNYDEGMEYPHGYHEAPAMREESPARMAGGSRDQSRDRLVSNAERMGQSPPPRVPRVAVGSRPGSAYGQLRSGPGTPYYSTDEETSYDYFRRGRGV